MEIQRIRDQLVEAALVHVTFDGWSRAALAEAARDLGLDPALPGQAFPGGAVDAVDHFAALADRLMAEEMAGTDFASLRTGPRIHAAVKARLARWSGQREAVRRALGVLALPHNLPRAARVTWRTVDAIWSAVEDQPRDFSWYSKRSTLAAVYSATVLYWLDDPSDDCRDTWLFLKRRLAGVRNLPKLRATLEGMLRLPRVRA